MPQRPRSHELETLSRQAFERILPSTWILRDIAGDYGIDAEVEIFEGGYATGEILKIQLKGTDARPSKTGSFSVSVDIEKITYWRKLDTPVLVVLYTAVDGSVYARWADSWDRYRSRNVESKTATFRFTTRERLSSMVSPPKLRRELAAIRSLRERRVPYEIGLNLDLSSAREELNISDLEAQIRVAFYQIGGLLIKSEGEADAYLTIDKMKIRLAFIGDVASCTLHFAKNVHAQHNAVEIVCADAMMVIALFLFNIGNSELAAKVALRYVKCSDIAERIEGLDELFQNMMADGMVVEGWKIVKPILLSSATSSRLSPPDFWMSQIIFHENFGILPAEVKDDIIVTAESIAEGKAALGSRDAGSSLYSVAKICQAIGRSDEAIKLLERTAKIDPKYLNRGYYHREIAGLYFERDDFDLAVAHYRDAVALDGPPESPYLLSDALMYCGRYEEASSITFDIATLSDFFRPGARIQQIVVEAVISVTGLGVQHRNSDPTDITADPALADDFPGVVSLLKKTDALDPRLWFLAAFTQEKESDALRCALVAAYVMSSSADMWVFALYLSIAVGMAPDLKVDVCRLAFRHCSLSDLVDAAANMDRLGVKDVRPVRDLILEFTDRPRVKLPRVIRFHNDDGTTSVYDVDSEDGRLSLGAAKYVSGLSKKRLSELFGRLKHSSE